MSETNTEVERHIVVSYRDGHLRVMPPDSEDPERDVAALREASELLAGKTLRLKLVASDDEMGMIYPPYGWRPDIPYNPNLHLRWALAEAVRAMGGEVTWTPAGGHDPEVSPLVASVEREAATVPPAGPSPTPPGASGAPTSEGER